MYEKNLKMLDDWLKNMGNPKLKSLPSLQKLYLESRKESNTNKKEILDFIIIDTLPKIHQVIKDSYLPYVCYHEFDMEDVLHSFLSIWISYFQNEDFLNWKDYTMGIEGKKMFYQLQHSYVPNSFFVSSFFNVNNSKFSQEFYQYLLTHSSPSSKSLASFFEEMRSILEETNFFNQEKTFSLRQIKVIIPFLIQKVLNQTYNQNPNFFKNLVSKDVIDEVENRMLSEQFWKKIKSIPMSKSQKLILSDLCNGVSQSALAQSRVCSHQYIQKSYWAALSALQLSSFVFEPFYELDFSPNDSCYLGIKKR